MKNLFAIAAATIVTASASFAVTLPTGTAMTDNAVTPVNSPVTISDVCSFSSDLTTANTLSSMGYYYENSKHYLYGGSGKHALSGALSTSGYDEVAIVVDVELADSFTGATQNTETSITQGSATAVTKSVTGSHGDTGGAKQMSYREPLTSGHTTLLVTDLVVESNKGFVKYATAPSVDVRISCFSN